MQAVGSPLLENIRKNMIQSIGSGPNTINNSNTFWFSNKAALGYNVLYNDTG
jgi:hypothetical protein